jgi:hypothetical protein
MRMAADHPDSSWVVGFCDESWWRSRLALPSLHSWSEKGEPLRLVEQSLEKDDPDPKAISCYGLYLPELDVRCGCALWGWSPGERDNYPFPFVVLL